jgi:hypothetical protein
MQSDQHERCRLLIDRAVLEGIPAEDQRWIESHQEECAACREYAEISLRTVRALDGFPIDVDTAAAERVRHVVRVHVEQGAAAEARSEGFPALAAVAFGLTIAGSFAMWRLVGWVAAARGIAPEVWQPGVEVLWILPSVMVDVVLLFHRQLSRKGQTL